MVNYCRKYNLSRLNVPVAFPSQLKTELYFVRNVRISKGKPFFFFVGLDLIQLIHGKCFDLK